MKVVRWVAVAVLLAGGVALAAVTAYIAYVARLWMHAMREEGFPPT